MRNDGRTSTQIRPLRFVPNFTRNPAGSVLVEVGDTMVLCTVSVQAGVPPWLRPQKFQQGWLTAEYCMVPSATDTRNKRERGLVTGRSQEIQRLIGRSLRGVMDLSKCPNTTFVVDCDVLQADGGTRTAAINGAWIALKIAIDKGLQKNFLKESPLLDNLAAVSIGLKNDELLLDLDYSEDSTADVDMSIVMTQSGKIQEVQCSSERAAFTHDQLNEAVAMAKGSLEEIFSMQNATVDEASLAE